MIKLLISLLLILSMAIPTSALEITAPEVPDSGRNIMPENTDSFGDGLLELLQRALLNIRPDLAEAAKVSTSIIGAVLIISILRTSSCPVKGVAEMAGAFLIVSIMMTNTNSMISLAAETIRELSDYGKLLFPVMTTAMVAQGGITTSAALYTGTTVFDAILSSFISTLLLPMIYLFLLLSVATSSLGEDILKKLRDLLKTFIGWILKMLLTVFTTYMSITGVVSGTTDAAALKATKVTISSVVPVVGSILSDASESLLVSAGLMKNAAGVYGILAVLAVYVDPFLRIGVHYLVLKATAAVSSIIGAKRMTDLIDDFSTAMGLLLAMTGASCLMLLISTVCFMKGVG